MEVRELFVARPELAELAGRQGETITMSAAEQQWRHDGDDRAEHEL